LKKNFGNQLSTHKFSSAIRKAPRLLTKAKETVAERIHKQKHNLRMSFLISLTPPMSLAEKTAYAEKLEEMLRVKLIKIAHYDQCVLIEIAATLALNQFQNRYTHGMIANDRHLRAEETRLTAAKTKAWNDRFAAESAAYPPTLESLLWIVAKSGYTKEVAPMMNLSKATRECKNLQRVMREVRTAIVVNDWREKGGMTQLHYFCERSMTSSVKRMLDMKSIDVEARVGRKEDGDTCLMTAAQTGHLDICRLLIDKVAQVKAKDRSGYTPLYYAAEKGRVEIVRLLCDRGADVEARTSGWPPGSRPLHLAAVYGLISVVKELIEVRNADINARDDDGRTALMYARGNSHDTVVYLISKGGIE